ncbi:unnamed protein product [Schistosoma turkestanicum]|nr:unnamed protein product [Schistosoma turkestanicum]
MVCMKTEIMANMILKEKNIQDKDCLKQNKKSEETCDVKSIQNTKFSIPPSSLQQRYVSEKFNKTTTRQAYSDRWLPKRPRDAVTKSTEENISVLLSRILTDDGGQSKCENHPTDPHVFNHVPKQLFIQETNSVNIASDETDEPVQQNGSVQTVIRPNTPTSKASLSIQCSVDKPTTNSVGIHCDMLSVIKSDDFSFVLGENTKLIAQQKAYIEYLKHALSAEQYKVQSLNSQLCKNQLEFDKAKLNWLQKENQFKVEKERFHRKISAAVIAKQQVSKNLEILREYIKVLKDHISVLEQSRSNMMLIPRYSDHFSPKQCDNIPTEITYSKVYLKNIDSIRSTPGLSATFPTLSRLLSLTSEYQDAHKCVTQKVLQCPTNQLCQTDQDVHNYNRCSTNQLSNTNNLDSSYDGGCIAVNSTLSNSGNIQKATVNQQEITEPDGICSSSSSISSSVSPIQVIDEMEFQDNLALLDQRINNVREFLKLNPVIF